MDNIFIKYTNRIATLITITVMVIALNSQLSFSDIFVGGNHARTSFLAEEVAIQMSALLGDPAFCSAHFGGLEIKANKLPINDFGNPIEFKNLNSKGQKAERDLLKKGTRYKNTVDIKDLRAKVDTQIINKKFKGSLTISTQGRSGYSSIVEKSIPLQFSVDANDKVVYCARPHLDEIIEVQPKRYSLTCNDYISAGWSNRSECLKDGRWHKVYSVPASTSSGIAIGSFDELAKLIQDGASVRTSITGTFFGITYENCFVVSLNFDLKKAFCAGGARSGVGNWISKVASPSLMQDDGGVTTGGVGYFSDGYLDFNSDNFNDLFPAGTDWFIKF